MAVGIEQEVKERAPLEAEPARSPSVAQGEESFGYVEGAVIGGTMVAALAGAVGGAKAVGTGALVGALAGAFVGNLVAETRREWAVTQRTLARMVGVSERSIAEWETKGLPARQAADRRLIEMRRLYQALTRVLPRDEISAWLERPNEDLNESTPLNVIERGHIDRIYSMIFYAESGTPG